MKNKQKNDSGPENSLFLAKEDGFDSVVWSLGPFGLCSV